MADGAHKEQPLAGGDSSATGDVCDGTPISQSGMRELQQTVTSGDIAIYLQFIIMDRSAYVWAGLDGEFGTLAVAIPPKFVRRAVSASCWYFLATPGLHGSLFDGGQG